MNQTANTLSRYDELIQLQLAESYMASGEYARLLECCNQLIDSAAPKACFHAMRATAHSEAFAFEKAADDMQRAVELDPDNATYHWRLGSYLVSREAVRYGRITEGQDKKTVQRIIRSYQTALEKDPTRSAAWINLLEVKVLTEEWDDAIACYGASRPYVTDPDFRLVRAFLGCLALVLAGDELLDEDLELLEDSDIALAPYTYRFDEIDTFLKRLDTRRFDPLRVARANQVRNRFVDHFTAEPKRYC